MGKLNFKLVPFLSILLLFGNCNVDDTGNVVNKKKKINTIQEVALLFENPPNHFRSAPLWVWNDDVTEAQIDQQLQDFKAGGMGGVFVHPRPGLITSYLSDNWFSLWKYTVKKGKELGMDVWIYDENSYPSGFAGGHVPAEMPESYNQGLSILLSQVNKLPDKAQDYYLILKKQDDKFIDISKNLDKEKNKEGDYYLYKKQYFEKSPWHGGYSYVDVLHKGVTEKFLEVTMTGYEKAVGDEFGKAVPGIFSDEPNIYPPKGLRWTPSLFEDFESRWGYDLKINLPSLDLEVGDWQRIRHNYYATLLELFIERWSKPFFNYTEKHNLTWTGHYWEHSWPNPISGADNMAMYAWHQMPGIDLLMNEYSEKVNAQFGNVRSVKELSSVGNQMGKLRTFSETYGAGGWDLRFQDMKRIGDWQYVLGVNFLNQHLSYMTLEGSRKRDHPQSFSYHEPWWKNYKVQGDYFGRLSLALSAGNQVNNILVLEPTTTAWMYFAETSSNKKYAKLGSEFQQFVVDLEKYQIEYDLGSENIIKDIGKIMDTKFVVGERSYNLVVIPPTLENLDKNTFELIKTYLKNGGKVISFNGIPAFVDGESNGALKILAKKHDKQWINAKSLSEQIMLDVFASEDIKFQKPEKIEGKLFHNRRNFEDGQLLFLVNTDMQQWSKGTFLIKGRSVKEFDLVSGKIIPYHSKNKEDTIEIEFDIPPTGSLLLSISNELSKDKNEEAISKSKIVEASNPLKIKKSDKNVLTLDYCDINIDGKIEKDLYVLYAADKIFKHYGLAGDPWSEAIQYKTNIIDQNTFKDNVGFEVSYSFSVEKGFDKSSLQVVVEHPELWQILINDKPVSKIPEKYWLDRKFAIYNIGKHVIQGENTIKLLVEKMTIYSAVESIYILGDFRLESQNKGWKLIAPQDIALGSWKKQGYPFYAQNVSYTKSYNLNSDNVNKRFIVKLLDWYGSVAEIKINNSTVGTIAWPPYELDITDQIVKGDNEITVEVSGTLKNLLGPHHIGKVRGTAWPASFQQGRKKMPAGDEYDFIDYGLFKDFILIKSDGPPQKVYWKIKRASKPKFKSVDSMSFNKPILVSLSTTTENAEIRYTLDGSTPKASSKRYIKPFLLKKSARVLARSFKNDFVESPVAKRSFYILDKKINGIRYKYYEDSWHKLPDFKTLKEIKKGLIYDISLQVFERRETTFAIEFSGYIKIDKKGLYTFYTNSNDGSKLFIDDIQVVDNDGGHAKFERQGNIRLNVGIYPLRVQYFDHGGSQFLEVYMKGPGLSKQLIPIDKLMIRKD